MCKYSLRFTLVFFSYFIFVIKKRCFWTMIKSHMFIYNFKHMPTIYICHCGFIWHVMWSYEETLFKTSNFHLWCQNKWLYFQQKYILLSHEQVPCKCTEFRLVIKLKSTIVYVGRFIWVLWAKVDVSPMAADDLERALFLMERLRGSEKKNIEKKEKNCRSFITGRFHRFTTYFTWLLLNLSHLHHYGPGPSTSCQSMATCPSLWTQTLFRTRRLTFKAQTPPEAAGLIESGGVEVPWVQGLRSR